MNIRFFIGAGPAAKISSGSAYGVECDRKLWGGPYARRFVAIADGGHKARATAFGVEVPPRSS